MISFNGKGKTYEKATTTEDGLMSKEDKGKLDFVISQGLGQRVLKNIYNTSFNDLYTNYPSGVYVLAVDNVFWYTLQLIFADPGFCIQIRCPVPWNFGSSDIQNKGIEVRKMYENTWGNWFKLNITST